MIHVDRAPSSSVKSRTGTISKVACRPTNVSRRDCHFGSCSKRTQRDGVHPGCRLKAKEPPSGSVTIGQVFGAANNIIYFHGTIRSTEPCLFSASNNPEGNPMISLPVDRALSIYGALADRSETKGARDGLSRHLMKIYTEGEKDQHRLTVHGLSYLRKLDQEIDSRN
jgi:hypothetical protein